MTVHGIHICVCNDSFTSCTKLKKILLSSYALLPLLPSSPGPQL